MKSEDLISAIDFLSRDESSYLLSRVNKCDKFAHEHIFYIGCPFYITNLSGKVRNSQTIAQHTDLMHVHFNDLLQKTISFFEDQLQKTVYIDPRVSIPGFHLIPCWPGLLEVKNYHFDIDYQQIAQNLPDLGIRSPLHKTFTLLISDHENLSAGLNYIVPTPQIDSESIKDIPFKKLQLIAKRHLYESGKLNILHGPIAHNIYSFNKDNKPLMRVTYQGNLVETSKGFLLYW